MTELDPARAWYEATRATLKVAERLGEKDWDDLPWDGAMARDNRPRTVESDVWPDVASVIKTLGDRLHGVSLDHWAAPIGVNDLLDRIRLEATA